MEVSTQHGDIFEVTDSEENELRLAIVFGAQDENLVRELTVVRYLDANDATKIGRMLTDAAAEVA
jgi:hypothetical protein